MPRELTFTFPLANGLHARPASFVEEVISGLVSEVMLVNHRNSRQADARSVLGLIGLDCLVGDTCSFRVAGADEEVAEEVLRTFLAQRFPNCDEAIPATGVEPGELRLPPSLRGVDFQRLRGVPVVPGIGRGRVVRLEQGCSFVGLPSFPRLGPQEEIARIDRALESLRARLEARLAQVGEGVSRQILLAHCSIVRDPELRARILEQVESTQCAASEAIVGAAAHFSAILETAQNPLLRERVPDLRDICQQLLEEIYGKAAARPKRVLHDDSICLAEDLLPSQFLELDRRRLRGLVLGRNGATSHVAILARSFSIPILGGLDRAMVEPREGQDAILDAHLGMLVIDPPEVVARYYAQEERIRARREEYLQRALPKESRTADGRAVGLVMNLSAACELNTPTFDGMEGVGLFRTEMLFLDRDSAPDEEEQAAIYRTVLEKAAGRPVTIRTLDIGGDKPLSYLDLPVETNPFLGYRAVRMYPEFEEILSTQFRALLRASVHGNLKILIPMVSCIDEIRWVKALLGKAAADCRGRGQEVCDGIPIGIMVEVPSAGFQIDHFSGEIDFFSIGTNDLLQYFMATERENSKVSHLFDPLHPSFLRFLKMIVDGAHARGKHVSMCGEMAGSVDALPLLVGLGLDALSVAGPRAAEMKHAILSMQSTACDELTWRALECATVEDVRSLLRKFAGAQSDRPLIDNDLVCMEADCASREQAIKEAVGLLYATGRTADPVGVEEDVWQREAVYSTGLGHGFAIPHCKSGAVGTNSICVMKLKSPVSWNSNDGRPVDVVILLAMRESDDANTHMKVFSRLARKVVHEDFRSSLRSETDAGSLLKYLKHAIELE